VFEGSRRTNACAGARNRHTRSRRRGVATLAATVVAGLAATASLATVRAATTVPPARIIAGTPTYRSDLYNAGGVAPLYPAGGATDSSGTMWLADSGGNRVDKVLANGTLSYVTPTSGAALGNPRNLSLDVSTPTDLWITDTGNNGVVEMTTAGVVLKRFNLTSSPQLSLKSPFGNDNNAADVFIADTYDHRVIAVSKTTGAIVWTTDTSCPSPGGKHLLRIRDVAVGSDGNIYAVDTDNNRVVAFAAANGACVGTPWSGISGHTLKAPRALVSDGSGGLWIADDGGGSVLLHYSDSGATFYGSTTNASGGGLLEPEGVFRDGTTVVVADPFAFRTITFTVSSGVPSAGGTAFFKGGPALGGFNNPFGIAYAPNGDCFVSDMFNQRLEKFTGCTGTPIAVGKFGGGMRSMQNPRGVSVSPDGSTLILTNSEDERIDLYSTATLAYKGSIIPVVSTCGGKKMMFPYQSAYDASNNSYWIVDTNNNRVLDLSSTGQCLENWTGGGLVVAPRGLAWDGTSVWVAAAQTGQILKCTVTGSCAEVAGPSGTATKLASPWNITIAGGELYIADELASKIVVMNMTAPYATSFTFGIPGSNPVLGQLGSPRSVSVNPVNGQIAVADFQNDDISFWS
jgi:hypothetical protein